MAIKQCLVCGKDFKTHSGKKNANKYCSRECDYSARSKTAIDNGFGKWMTGKSASSETREKMSNSRKGDRSSNWKGGLPKCKMCGKELSLYTVKLCNSCARSKENNPAWNGGITPKSALIRNSKRMENWRLSVFERDNWTCQKHNIKGNKLRAHHIQNFASNQELRFDINNGVTLSEKAHREFHKIYGIRNNTQEQMNEFLAEHTA